MPQGPPSGAESRLVPDVFALPAHLSAKTSAALIDGDRARFASITACLDQLLDHAIVDFFAVAIAIAAPRLPLGVVGVLQYVAPTIQFLLGLTVFKQVVTPSYWAGLILVWCGSVVYLATVFSRTRRARAARPSDATTPH